MPLVHTSAGVLEFESLRDLLRGYTSSPLGSGRIATLAPSTDRSWIELQQQLTSEIREFSVSTLEKLGGELSRGDEISTRATQLFMENQRLARAMKLKGWVNILGRDEDVVYLVGEAGEGRRLAAVVRFRGSATPQLEDGRNQPLPDNVAVRYKARQIAIVTGTSARP